MRVQEVTHCICGGNNSEFLFSTKDFRLESSNEFFKIMKCNECGLVYLKNRIEGEELYDENFYRHNNKLSDIVTKLAHKNIIKVLKKIKQNGKILDIGCGTGILLDSLKKYGYDVYGIETSVDGYLLSRKHEDKIYNKFLKECKFPTGFFDIITLFHVLEHIPEPVNELLEIKRVLKPDGILIIEVPNIDSLGFRIFGKYWISLDSPRHMFHFNYSTLTAILIKNGFYILRKAGFSRFFDSPLSLIKSFNNYLKSNFLNKTIAKIILYFAFIPLVLLNILANIFNRFSPVIQVYCKNK